MAVDTVNQPCHPFDLKSAQLPVLAVMLKTTALADVIRRLVQQITENPDFFDHTPVLIDLTAVREATQSIDFAVLVQALRTHGMQPVSVRGGNPAQMAAAHAAGLSDAAPLRILPPAREIVHEVFREVEVVREVQVPVSGAVLWNKSLRSGQKIHAPNADLIVVGAVSFGAEVVADGNIHVYGPLRGRALAGARGNQEARIFSTCMQAQLVSIAGLYRTAEIPLPSNVLGKCTQIRRVGKDLLIEPL